MANVGRNVTSVVDAQLRSATTATSMPSMCQWLRKIAEQRGTVCAPRRRAGAGASQPHQCRGDDRWDGQQPGALQAAA